MLTKRIIPCLDVANGRVVKGINFLSLRDAGDPVELAAFYNEEGADEVVFLDITASHERRATMLDVVQRTAERVFIDEKITSAQSQPVFRHEAAVFKAIFAMQRAIDDAFLAAKIIRRDKHRFAYDEADVEMGGVLKLVIDVAAQVGDVPAHAQWLQRAQHSAWIKFPGMVGIIQVAKRREIVLRNHCLCSILFFADTISSDG